MRLNLEQQKLHNVYQPGETGSVLVTQTSAAVCFQDDHVLLLKHAPDQQAKANLYGFPAGKVEPKETPRETAVRELREETGLVTTVKDLIEFPEVSYSFFSDKHWCMFVFIVENWSGTPGTTPEGTPEWVPINKLSEFPTFLNVTPLVKRIIDWR